FRRRHSRDYSRSASRAQRDGFALRSSGCSSRLERILPARSGWPANGCDLETSLQRPVSAEESLSNLHVIHDLPVLVVHAHSSCNCRCVMCDIWKTQEGKAFRKADLEPHLASIRRLGVRWVVFSGGEPLMNAELP